MVYRPVKGKELHNSHKFLALGLIGAAVLTFAFSIIRVFPAGWVESFYSRTVFPWISTILGWIADLTPFAWLDLLVTGAVLYIAVCVWKRRFLAIGILASLAYLMFFWSWGLNYHRLPLEDRLQVDTAASPAEIAAFARQAAQQLNTLYNQGNWNEVALREEAVVRVSRVVEVLDGTRWQAANRVKVSLVANPWFRVAGIDGLFNPIVHEPIVTASILDIERPFILAHELAHVRGYPDEGDANFVALLATLASGKPEMQYSGWMHLWLYLRDKDLDALLEPGPRQDIQRIFDRSRRDRIVWLSNVQSAVFDAFLKANSVSEGVQSYSRIVLLAVGTQNTWERFR